MPFLSPNQQRQSTEGTDNMALLAITSCCCRVMQQSINISCLLNPQQQTCSGDFAAVGLCWD